MAEEHSSIRQAAWADKILHGGESDTTKPIGLSPLEMYRATRPEIDMPSTSIDAKPWEEGQAVYRTFWGKGFEKKQGRDTKVAWLADVAITALLRDPELEHIFTDTARDFDTIHELQRFMSSLASRAFVEGFAEGLPTEESQ